MEKTLQEIQMDINNIKIYMSKLYNNDIPVSIKYFRGENIKISGRKMEFVHEGKLMEDFFKSNEKIIKNDYRVIVEQLTSYLLGKAPSITGVDAKLTNELPLKKAWRIAKKSLKQCQIQKIAWVQPFIDKFGNIDFTIHERSDNIIPIYSLDVDHTLLAVIRHYEVDIIVAGNIKTVTRIEYWDSEMVTYYKVDGKKAPVFWNVDEYVTINPKPHVFTGVEYKNAPTVFKSTNNWGKVPFIPVQFNEEYQTALQMVGKSKVDALDFLMSDGVNNLLDMADVIYILKDYIGKPEEALFNLKTKRAAVVGGGGDVKSLTTDIPIEARQKMISLMKEAIYTDGMGLDLSNLTGSSLTNEVLEAYFELLNMKANNVSPEIEKLYTELLTFVDIKQKGYPKQEDYEPIAEPTITFNKSVIINEIEYINASNTSAGFISDETRWSWDPRVDDPKEEAKKMEDENPGLD